MFLAPLVAELLPGATRISAIFVLPIEILIWGSGAVLIREAVRRWKLGWLNLLLLAAALSVAEECLIQQTSLAPLVIKLKGYEYARSFDFNYVYFVWALIYEVVFAVVVPIGLAELIFRRTRPEPWLNRAGAVVIGLLFLPASFLAWFSWTQIARPKVFHLEAFQPPAWQLALAASVIVVLVSLALGPSRCYLARSPRSLAPPHGVLLLVFCGVAVVVLFGLELLAFGIRPKFSPSAAVAMGLTLAALLVYFLPRWRSHPNWRVWHEVGALYGAVITNMAVFFIAFLGSTQLDFYGKAILDVIAVAMLALLAARIRLPRNRVTAVFNRRVEIADTEKHGG
jgi:hypothetical protein